MIPTSAGAWRPLFASGSAAWTHSLRRLAPIAPRVTKLRDSTAARCGVTVGGGLAVICLLRLTFAGTGTATPTDAALYLRPSIESAGGGFETNRGQARGGVEFLARGGDLAVFVAAGELVLTPERGERRAPTRVRWAGARERPRITGEDPLPESRHFRRSMLDEVPTEVKSYGAVAYEGLYPGIDLHVSTLESSVRLRFHVDRGASPSRIRLLLTTGDGLTTGTPVAYQTIGNGRTSVAAQLCDNGDSMSFETAAYDVREPLELELHVRMSSAESAAPQTLAMAQ